MQPPASVPLKPGLERSGLPWGRDLFTFVTSAAGHVMRILQKPRKKRPSKRQVNHRRFLHNMIQRKFADIEAANHRLASALFSPEQENKVPCLSVREEQSHGASRGASQTRPEAGALADALEDAKRVSKSGSGFSRGSPDPAEGSEKNQSDSGHQWTLNHKRLSDTYAAISNQDKGTDKYAGRKKASGDRKLVEIPEHVNVREEHFQTGHCYGHENPPEAADRPPQSSLCCSWTECDSLSKIIPLSHHHNLDTCDSPSLLSLELSLSLSPLSLESCDFFLLPDVPPCSLQPRKDAAHCAAEGQQHLDEMYPLDSDFGDGDSVAPAGVEGYVDSVLRGGAYRGAYWGGVIGGTSTDDDARPDQPEIFADKTILVHRRNNGRSESEAGHSSECRGVDYGYGRGGGGGGGCGRDHGDVGETTLCYYQQEQQQGNSHCRMASDRQEEPTEIDFSCFESSTHCEGVVPNQLQATPETYHYDVLPLEASSSSCMYHEVQVPRRPESRFMALDGGDDAGTPKNVSFEGVAQSFSVPPQFSHWQHPVLSSLPRPLEEDWLFTDILQDRKSPQLSNNRQGGSFFVTA